MSDKSFTERLVQACGEMGNPPLDSKNPHFGNRFSSLLAVSNAVRPVLARHGIAYRQSVMRSQDGASCVCTYAYGAEPDGTLAEKSLATVPITVVADPQKQGSALTYAKRYCLLAAFGLVGDEDDDAEAAQGRAPESAQKPQMKASGTRGRKSAQKAAESVSEPQRGKPSEAEAAELRDITEKVGDKAAVWSAFKANGMEGARALLAFAEPAASTPPTYEKDVEF